MRTLPSEGQSVERCLILLRPDGSGNWEVRLVTCCQQIKQLQSQLFCREIISIDREIWWLSHIYPGQQLDNYLTDGEWQPPQFVAGQVPTEIARILIKHL